MKKTVFLAFLIVTSIFACGPEDINPDAICTNLATVEDFTGLDGCGFLFKLDNGDYLQPIISNIGWCGTPPLPESYYENPLANFELKAGQRVRLGYEAIEDYGTICINGKAANITCLELISEAPRE